LTPYELSRVAFEKLFTAPFATNIQKREETNISNVKTITYTARNIPDKLAIGVGTNRLFKSFIFDNIALTFRVKGQPYRSAGKFIQISADDSSISTATNKNNKSNELNGYWYIISIKHVFENDIYFNDYICVKVYSNFGNLSEIPITNFNSSPQFIPGAAPFGNNTSTAPILPNWGEDIQELQVLPPKDIPPSDTLEKQPNNQQPFNWKLYPDKIDSGTSQTPT
jgi:hypothetical protein